MLSGDAGPSALIDCRWLGYTGIGSVTRGALAGLAELAPPGRWVLWGPPAVAEFVWPGARHEVTETSPLALAGQRALGRVPPSDTALFLHVVRPVVRRPSVVMVHDTIPLHWAERSWERFLWRQYFGASARAARRVLVQSEATAAAVAADLGIRTVTRVDLPGDEARAARVRARRQQAGRPAAGLLYVGRVRPHKNLVRAIAGFHRSAYAGGGATFTIVGADERGREVLAGAPPGPGRVEVVDRCSDDELEALYAASEVLIQPSLAEGFGLTVVEGLAAGIAVCCSDIAALREAAGGQAVLFDPWSPAAIADAIDRTVSRLADGWRPVLPAMATPVDFARHLVGALESVG